MRKKIVLVLIVALVLTCVLTALCACESYKASAIKPAGDKNAVVESNGKLVVKQGSYLYFVNGYGGYLTEKGKDNWFGHVTKGAIVRVSYHEDGSLGDDYKVVVPKDIMADSANVGFSIFGNYIYYVSPSADEDRSGKVQTDTLQFMRTKLDGTGTQVILNWNSTSVEYKYTPSALVYYDKDNSKLYSKSLTAKKFKKKDKGKCIAEDVTSVHFPACDYYDPAQKEANANEYVLFTKASEDSFEYSNTLYIVHASGKDQKEVIGASSFENAKYSVSVLASSVSNGKLAIYYTKTSYIGTSNSGTAEGTFAYEFADKKFAFNPQNEVKLTSESLSSVYAISYARGIVSKSGKSVIYHTDGTDPETFGDLSLSELVAVDEAGNNFIYVSDSKLCYYSMDNTENAQYALNEEKSIMTSFTGADVVDGYLYFIVDDDYDYVYRLKIAGMGQFDKADYIFERVALLTAADQKKIEAAEAEEESSEKSDK